MTSDRVRLVRNEMEYEDQRRRTKRDNIEAAAWVIKGPFGAIWCTEKLRMKPLT